MLLSLHNSSEGSLNGYLSFQCREKKNGLISLEVLLGGSKKSSKSVCGYAAISLSISVLAEAKAACA